MGGSTKQTSTTDSTTAPWSPAQPTLTGILGQLQPQLANTGINPTEQGAFNQLTANAQAGNPYAVQIGSLATNLLNGGGANAQAGNVSGALDSYKSQLTPYANGSMIGNNPALQAQLDTIMSDVGNNVNSQFAAAGRDMSGANQQAYGRGVAQGIAPVLANQYNQDVSNQLSAAGSLYGAGNTTAGLLSGMNQQGLANQQQGVDTSSAALQARDSGANQLLQLESQQRQLPLQNLSAIEQLGVPIAGLGSEGHSQTQQTTQQPLGQQIMGGLLGGLGLAGQLGGFGPTGWLYGSGKGAGGLLNGLFGSK